MPTNLERHRQLAKNTTFEPIVHELERLREAHLVIGENVALLEKHANSIKERAPITYRALRDVIDAHRSAAAFIES